MSKLLDNLPELVSFVETTELNIPPSVIRIICELLDLRVAPEDIYKILRDLSVPPKTEEAGSSTA
ncbi:uncharacterized protein LOC141531674 [Cotesia typhae]|uniref:uncharacterized protein LOC141531674 n=1 Tax=Cotesia typhae TaxID=2053667 RepID=UPI003D68819B